MTEQVPWDEFRDAMKTIRSEEKRERAGQAESALPMLTQVALSCDLFVRQQSAWDWCFCDTATGQTVVQYWPTKGRWYTPSSKKKGSGTPEDLAEYLRSLG